MKFHLETFAEQQKRIGEWRKFFAWWPVHLGNGNWVWMEFLLKRGFFRVYWGGGGWEYEYKELN